MNTAITIMGAGSLSTGYLSVNAAPGHEGTQEFVESWMRCRPLVW